MKIISKTSLILTAIVAIVSFSSCSVEYRARHPRPVRHKRVIVVGMAAPAAPVETATIAK